MRTHLFIPCLVDQTAPLTGIATVRLLERIGHEVVYDSRQTCCGQALFNAGFRKEARLLAERFLRIFNDAEIIVAPSGSCVSMVKGHYGELELSSDLTEKWMALKDRIWELCAFLIDKLEVTDVGASFPHRVTYHPSCHLLRNLGIDRQPLQLLQQVRNIEFIQDDSPVECCGFGGVFSAKYAELSRSIADRRAAVLAGTSCEYVTGADDSCLINLQDAFSRIGRGREKIRICEANGKKCL